MDESLEQIQSRHRKEQRELQGRITNKKKNATKKTRKFVNDECAELERQLKDRQEAELRQLARGEVDELDGDGENDQQHQEQAQNKPPPQSPQQQPPAAAAVNTLASQLESTTLSPSEPQPEQQQQPKQKRNRQKERLARRAAEAQAAADAAASEAAAMPDRRAQEQSAMQRAFAAHALREHPIAPDGHCLFSAVADQLGEQGIPLSSSSSAEGGLDMQVSEGEDKGLKPRVAVQPYKQVRQAAAEWIAQHRGDYEPFLEEGVDGYVARIRDTAEWGGELELSALANAYGVEIRVVQGGDRVEVVKPTAGGGKGEVGGQGLKTLWLAYYRHGYGLGEHYNSLRKAA